MPSEVLLESVSRTWLMVYADLLIHCHQSLRLRNLAIALEPANVRLYFEFSAVDYTQSASNTECAN